MTRGADGHESKVIQKEKQLEEERDRRGQNTEQATGRAGQQKRRLEKQGPNPVKLLTSNNKLVSIKAEQETGKHKTGQEPSRTGSKENGHSLIDSRSC